MHPDGQPLFFVSRLRPNVGRLRWPGTTRAQPWSMVSIFIWDDLTSYWYRNFKNRFVPSQPHTSYFKRCFKYNRAQVWNCKSHDLCSAVTLRPRCTGQILVHFAKNLSSVLWDRCAWWFFSLPYFAKPYQSSKVLYHSTLRQDKFVSSVKSDRFFKLWFKGKH